MKVFITGLCLQGNKGGPALALSLMDQIRARMPKATFTLAVPGEGEFAHERRWAHRYGVQVVRQIYRDDAKVWRWRPRDMRHRAARLLPWTIAAVRSDAVLDMSGICYVGPPVGTEEEVLASQRVVSRRMARRLGRRFFAWTQSYGPFSTPEIARLAKEDLGSLPMVFCRGDLTLDLVKALLPNKPARSFPDVAIVLGFDRAKGKALAADALGSIDGRRLVTISPSAVLHRKMREAPGGDHVDRIVEFVEYLIDKDYAVLLVPHTFRPGVTDPDECDLAVCKLIAHRLRGQECVGLVSDDLSANELKSIISAADIHVGARYHSMVAALSAGVPGISLSWHHKYGDLMKAFGAPEFLHDPAVASAAELEKLFEAIEASVSSVRERLQSNGERMLSEVHENADILVQWLRGDSQ